MQTADHARGKMQISIWKKGPNQCCLKA